MSDLEKVLEKIQTFVKQKGVYFEEWFGQFDRLNSGRVYLDQFRRSFTQIRYEISEEDYQILIKKYSRGDRVNYRQFCDDIEEIITKKDLEKKPLDFPIDAEKVISRTLGRIDTITDQQVISLLSKLYHQTNVRGLKLREIFMDFDRHNCGRITQSQFSRSNPFKDLNASELALLYKRYSDPVLRDFNYRKLINDVNDYEKTIPSNIEPARERTLLPHQSQSFKYKQFDKDPSQIIPKFAEHVRKERIRILDFFQQHDVLRCGRIAPVKFQGTLTLFNYPFTEKDIEYLTKEYMVNINFTNYVKYKDFCKDVEAAAEAQINPVMTIGEVEDTIDDSDPRLQPILDRIRSTIVKFRINVLPTIQDFDRLGRGYVTQVQFHRALTSLRINLSNEEAAIVGKAYEKEMGIDIYRFIEDVDPDHKQKRRSFKPVGTTRKSIEDTWGKTPTGDRFVTGEQADELIYKSKRGLFKKVNEHRDPDELVADIKEWSQVNGVIFTEFIEPFDQHNWGEIPVSAFRSAMTISTYQLTEDEFDALVAKYASKQRPGFVRWRDFDNDIKEFTAPLDLEQTPRTTPINPRERTIQKTQVREKLSPRVKEIMENIAKFMKNRRISLIDQFRDNDPLNHRKVTAIAFTRILQLIGCYLSKEEIDSLCTYYNDPATNFVDYKKFTADVDEMTGLLFGDTASTSLVMNPIPHYMNDDTNYLVSVRSTPIPDLSWPDILKKIQSFVFKRRVRLIEFFGGFDPLRSGKITKQKFHTVVGQSELPITGKDIEVILREFSVPGADDLFAYRPFCAQVNDVFGPTELNRKPLDSGKPTVTVMPEPSMTTQRLSSDLERFIRHIMKKMSQKVVTRRMNIREQFLDFDRYPRKKYITKIQFKQCIARLGLTSDPQEFDALCRKYKCTELDDINYAAFCDDLERAP